MSSGAVVQAAHAVAASVASMPAAQLALVGVATLLLGASVGISFGARQLYIDILCSILAYSERVQLAQQQRRRPPAPPPVQAGTDAGAAAGPESGDAGEDAAHNTEAAGARLRARSTCKEPSPVVQACRSRSSSVGAADAPPDDGRVEKRPFHFEDALPFATDAIVALVEDEVTPCFREAELPAWNMLTRTGEHFDLTAIPPSLVPLWAIGFLWRYAILLPIRLTFALAGIAIFVISFTLLALIGRIRVPVMQRVRRVLERQLSFVVARLLVLSWSAVITYHDRENRAPGNGICVANHTSPIDCIVLANDNCYSMVGQRHGGAIGLLQSVLSIAQRHIWFERSEARDRATVTRRLREHVADPANNPVLIFPEGTCINNTAVMMFKKGCFEVGATIYPVAIKYDPLFGDCFWDSSRQSFLTHVLALTTSWAVVCDVWYLPPMQQQPGESSVDFANRVKSLIAQRGGLVDLTWDGMLKRQHVKPYLMEQVQRNYASQLRIP